MSAAAKSFTEAVRCQSPLARPSLGKSIIIAESVSSVVSLGSAWVMGKHPEVIEPAKNFLARHIFYPILSGECQCSEKKAAKTDPGLMEKAQQKASLLVKGVIMVGSGLLTYVPTQMLMEGKCDLHEFKQVVKGKSLGLVATLVALGTLGKFAPQVMENVKNAADKYVATPLCYGFSQPSKPQDNEHKGGHCRETRELCKLLIMDIPSSVISGLVNYGFTRHARL